MNNLSSFDPELLSDVISLETLHMSHNKIKDLDDNILEKAPIKELDMSFNKLANKVIRSLDTRITSVFINIRKLSLRGNHLTGYIDMREVDTSKRSDEIIIDLTAKKINQAV